MQTVHQIAIFTVVCEKINAIYTWVQSYVGENLHVLAMQQP